MSRIRCREFNAVTIVFVILTFPILLLVASIKAIGIGLRELFERKKLEWANEGSSVGVDKNNDKQRNAQLDNDKSSQQPKPIHHTPSPNTERYDILYTALKKSAYNQYFGNYHNYLAQRYQAEYVQWKQLCEKIEKKNNGFFNRLRGKEKTELPPPPQPPQNPARLHQFSSMEIDALHGLAVVEGVNANNPNELIAKTYYQSSLNTPTLRNSTSNPIIDNYNAKAKALAIQNKQEYDVIKVIYGFFVFYLLYRFSFTTSSTNFDWALVTLTSGFLLFTLIVVIGAIVIVSMVLGVLCPDEGCRRKWQKFLENGRKK